MGLATIKIITNAISILKDLQSNQPKNKYSEEREAGREKEGERVIGKS